MFFRIMGGALAIGILGAILAARLSAVPGVSPTQANELLGPAHGRTLSPEVFRALASSLENSLHLIFWLIAGLSVLAFLVSLSFPTIRAPQESVKADPAASD
jgi:hypothetical protein